MLCVPPSERLGVFCCSTLTPQEQSGGMFAGFGEHENQQTYEPDATGDSGGYQGITLTRR